MASKQTAVEWLVEQIFGDHTSEWQKQIDQAKELEKQQIVETYNEGALDGLQLGEQYYNHVFNL